MIDYVLICYMIQTYPIVNMAAGHIFAQNNRTETNRYFGWIQPWHNYETFNIIQLVSMFIGPAWNSFLCIRIGVWYAVSRAG